MLIRSRNILNGFGAAEIPKTCLTNIFKTVGYVVVVVVVVIIDVVVACVVVLLLVY